MGPKTTQVPTLADAGIDKHLADRARKYAAIPEGEFDDIIDDWRGRVAEENSRVTVSLLEACGRNGKPHVSNNSGYCEWYTPPEILDAAREVLGGFDLDPASSEIANRTVRAARFFTAEDDGLTRDWPSGRIWMNPPYATDLVGQFTKRFAAEVERGSTGIVLVNNATETGWFQDLASKCSASCFPRGRVKFRDATGAPVGAPLQGQALLYFAPDSDAFAGAFQSLGLVSAWGWR